jgi:hypothetical protein
MEIRRQEIKGGTVDDARKGVVGMMIIRGFSAASCTGSLLAPNLVLTARHCVSQSNTEQISCASTDFGDTFSTSHILVTTETSIPYNQPRSDKFVGVREIVTPQDSDFCGNDVALLVLSENISTTDAEPIVPRLDDPVDFRENYTAVGYGHIGDGTGSGTRRQLADRQVYCEGGNCPAIVQAQITNREFIGSDGTCQGDSGGPALDSAERVIGVLSRGGGNCDSSIYTSVRGWKDWIRQEARDAAQIGGYTPPAWTTEDPDDPDPGWDLDNDGTPDSLDNCPRTPNPDQEDRDEDGTGDHCADPDEDEHKDIEDNCPDVENADQLDTDEDGIGDACDEDDDEDGVEDGADNCPLVDNADQSDVDDDGIGDACDDTDDRPDDTEEDSDIVLLDDEEGPRLVEEDGQGEEDPRCTIASTATPAGGPGPLSALAGLAMLGLALVRRRLPPLS